MPVPESDFTAPSPWCAEPRLWRAHDNQAAEVEVSEFVGALVRLVKPAVAVETGTHRGHTAVAIGEALKANGVGHLYTLEVDPVAANVARQRVAHLPVTLVEKSSLEWFPPDDVQFAWLDSAIDIRGAEAWRLRVFMPTGALIGFHDVAPQHPEVWPQIERLERAGMVKAIRLRTPRGVALAEVL